MNRERLLLGIAVAEGAALLVLAFLLVGRGSPPTLSPPAAKDAEAPGPATGSAARPFSRPPVAAELASAKRPVTPAPAGPSAAAEGAPVPPAPATDEGTGLVLFGAVRDPDGKPVEANLWLHDPDGKYQGVQGSRFAFAGLRPGKWKLSGRANGFKDIAEEMEIGPSPSILRRDVTLQPAVVIKVKFLTPDGRPFIEAFYESLKEEATVHFFEGPILAVATKSHPGKRLPLTPYRGHERFGIGEWRAKSDLGDRGKDVPKGWDGVLQVSDRLPVFVSAVFRHVILATTEAPAGSDEVVLRIPTEAASGVLAKARLKLVDAETGVPISKGSVELHDRQSMGQGTPLKEDGTVTIENEVPGILELSIWTEGYESVNHYVRLEPGILNDLGTLALHRGRTISGRIVGPEGKGLKCSLSFSSLDRLPYPQDLDVGSNWGTDEEGRFTIQGATRGRVLLLIQAEGLAARGVLVDTAAGDVSGLEIALQGGAKVTIEPKVEGTVGYTFWLTDEKGVIVWTDWVWGPWPRTLELAPGKYTLTTYDDEGRQRKTVPMEVGATPLTVSVDP